jgi:hypothetical protein
LMRLVRICDKIELIFDIRRDKEMRFI